MTHRITLAVMRFHAFVGILPHEREISQPIEVDLRVDVADGPDVVDYRGLYDSVAAVVGAGHIDFLEQVADRIAGRALAVSPRIRVAWVGVRKPHVALGGPLAFVEVAVERSAE